MISKSPRPWPRSQCRAHRAATNSQVATCFFRWQTQLRTTSETTDADQRRRPGRQMAHAKFPSPVASEYTVHLARPVGFEHSALRRGAHSRKRSHQRSARMTRPVNADDVPDACLKSGAKSTRAARPNADRPPGLNAPLSRAPRFDVPAGEGSLAGRQRQMTEFRRARAASELDWPGCATFHARVVDWGVKLI
eukprot:5890860-Pyramimonas_sp.AAC.2